MTISANVRKELFEMTANEGKLIRIKPTEAKAGTTVYSSKQAQPLKMWTQEEHEKFLEAMEQYPSGPWKVIASQIGTKTTRQTMTHAQKYRQKISRWRRGLRHKGRKHRDAEGEANEDDNDAAAKDNLFRAIDLVAGEQPPAAQAPAQAQAQAQGKGKNQSQPKGQGTGNQLFRLAELASIEVMKSSSPSSDEEKEDAENAENASADENNSAAANGAKKASSKAGSKKTAAAKKKAVGNTPQENPEPETKTAAKPDDEEEAKAQESGDAIQLPPLKMSPPREAETDSSVIPPLRSKINPSVLPTTI